MRNKYNYILPFTFSILMIIGILAGMRLNPGKKSQKDKADLYNEVLERIRQSFFEEVNTDTLVDEAILATLGKLDPHSDYIPLSRMRSAMQDLQGNFEGIGIEFFIIRDTIAVINTIPGGPSENAGIISGDKIIAIDGENVAGKGISNTEVRNKLLGKKGTSVKLNIYRAGKILDFTIIRDKIPMTSIDAAYLMDNETGYIKINRFSEQTNHEFSKSLSALKSQGMKHLIMDLCGNPGGSFEDAIALSDQFFDAGKILVFTLAKNKVREDFYSTDNGNFKQGRLIVLIDENSASASEIVAGAIQDYDRGLLVGRRSFGKGLVQKQFFLSDNSVLRLTVAKYYTPSGRCIQHPYNKGKESYYMDHFQRYQNGEMYSAGSDIIHDSLKFKTQAGRIVYASGGIVPDVFVPLDTSYYSDALRQILSKGLIVQFCLYYTSRHRADLLKNYPDFNTFNKSFDIEMLFSEFQAYIIKDETVIKPGSYSNSALYIRNLLKSNLARYLYGNESYYKVLNTMNPIVLEGYKLIKSEMLNEKGIVLNNIKMP